MGDEMTGRWARPVALGTLQHEAQSYEVTPYGGPHADTEPMMQTGRAVDPDRYFIIVPNMLGNGLSSSPSNTLPPFDRAAFRTSPCTTMS
jgi:homoserine O-acetyltransferase/O-succinyltransferase